MHIGIKAQPIRKYGTATEHDKAHGLDTASLRARIGQFVGAQSASTGA
jgi:hypothetical protein